MELKRLIVELVQNSRDVDFLYQIYLLLQSHAEKERS
jgi:hypothetical protein